MKKILSVFISMFIVLSLVSCGGSPSQKAVTETQNTDYIKPGVVSFISNLSKTASIPDYVIENLKTADNYTLNVNKSGGGTFFHLVIHSKKPIQPSEIQEKDISIVIEGNTITIEGSAPITFEDAATMVFSDSAIQWVLHLFYDKTSMFTVGKNLPHGATLFVLSVNEGSPWDTYISLKSMGVAKEDPTEKDGVYTLTLSDGHKVYIISTQDGVDIYK